MALRPTVTRGLLFSGKRTSMGLIAHLRRSTATLPLDFQVIVVVRSYLRARAVPQIGTHAKQHVSTVFASTYDVGESSLGGIESSRRVTIG